MILKTVRLARNGLAVYRLYRQLNQSQWLSADELHTLQTVLFRQVLDRALRFTPYYRSLSLPVTPETATLADLRHFPVISKDVVRARFADFMVEGVDPTTIQWKQTSGSSGKPFKVPKWYFSDALEAATQFRAFSMAGVPYRPRDPLVMLRTYAPTPGQPVFHHDRIRNYWYLSPFDINERHLPTYLEVFARSGAQFLKGYASSIYLFTCLLRAQGVPPPPAIRVLITSSESMLPHYRQVIESYWGIPVLDWYGQNERTVTASQCSAGRYHNNDEYGYIELGPNNEIIATSLRNTLMPLIRYNTGDIAIPTDDTEACPCGRGLRVVFRAIDGRSDDIIHGADGTAMSSVNIYTAMQSFDEVRQFKLTQRPDRSLWLQLVLERPLSDARRLQIRNALLERIGVLPLDIDTVNDIPRNSRTEKLKAIESLRSPTHD